MDVGITCGYTEEQWDKLKKESPNLYKDIPMDKLYITCEGCHNQFQCIELMGDTCPKCNLRWDEQSTW